MKPLRRLRQHPLQPNNPKHRKAVATRVAAAKAVAAMAAAAVVDLAAAVVVADLAVAVDVAVEAHAAKSARLPPIPMAMNSPKRLSSSTVAPKL